MRIFLIAVFLFALAIMTAIFLHQDAGSVQIAFRDKIITAKLVYAIYGVLLAFFLLYLLLRLIGVLFRVPSSWKESKARRSSNAASKRLVVGSVDLMEGHFERAEKALIKDVPSGPEGLLHYLAAAEAAQGQGNTEFKEKYLKQAAEHHSEAKFGIDLNRAQHLIDEGATEKALEASRLLVKKQSRNPRATGLLAQSLSATENWAELKDMLPALHKYSSLSKKQVSALEALVGKASSNLTGDKS